MEFEKGQFELLSTNELLAFAMEVNRENINQIFLDLIEATIASFFFLFLSAKKTPPIPDWLR